MMRVRLGWFRHSWSDDRWCIRFTLTLGHRERAWLDVTRHYGLRVRLFGLTLLNRKDGTHAKVL